MKNNDAFWNQEIEIFNSDGIMDTITQRQYHEMCAAVLKLEKANTKVEKLRDALEEGLISLTAVAGHTVQPEMAADARAKIVIIQQAIADSKEK